MISQERARLSEQLAINGHVVTSAEKLEIAEFEAIATDLIAMVNANDQLTDGTNAGMIMCKDSTTKAAGSRLVRPILEALFPDNPSAVDDWDMYTVNRYETGAVFKPHQDYLEKGTVMIIGACGTRLIDIYNKEPEDDVFKTIDVTYTLSAGSILLLDAVSDLGHGITCVEGPSISVVGDLALSLFRDN